MRRFLQTLVLFNTDSDYVPRLLRRGAVAGLWCLVLLSFLTTNMQALLWQSSTWLVSNVLPAIVVEQTNTERLANAAFPLRRSAVLDEAATRKAEHMAREGYFAHYSPEGVSPWHWFDEVGYVYAHAGENLAVHFTDSSAVVEAWMQSPTHRANIVNNNYREIGVGTAKGIYEGFDTVFVVQLFGTPGELPATPEPLVSGTDTSLPYLIPDAFVVSTTSVTLAATATPVALAYESTPRQAGASTTSPLPDLSLQTTLVPGPNDIVSLSSGLVATSSGLPVAAIVTPSSAGATDTAVMAKVATQPNLVLATLYVVLSIVVGGMLVLALTLTARSHRWLQMAHSVLLLLLMAGLVQLHFFLTSGAVVS